jgi:hypothetical protein
MISAAWYATYDVACITMDEDWLTWDAEQEYSIAAQ